MELIIFVGLQASGKSTFFKNTFYDTHMRLNLDMLRTRHRESIYVEASLQAKQPFVIDNTNPERTDRAPYIAKAKAHSFQVVCYYFIPDYAGSALRNEERSGKAKVPEIGIKSVMKKLQPPEFEEGFDEIFEVTLEDGAYIVHKRSKPEIPEQTDLE